MMRLCISNLSINTAGATGAISIFVVNSFFSPMGECRNRDKTPYSLPKKTPARGRDGSPAGPRSGSASACTSTKICAMRSRTTAHAVGTAAHSVMWLVQLQPKTIPAPRPKPKRQLNLRQRQRRSPRESVTERQSHSLQHFPYDYAVPGIHVHLLFGGRQIHITTMSRSVHHSTVMLTRIVPPMMSATL